MQPWTPISCSALLFLMSHMGNGNKLRVGMNKLVIFTAFLYFPVLSPSFPPPYLINNGGIGDRALFCHLTSPPQTQQQADRDAPREQITASVQYTWRKPAWLPAHSWIQLFSQYYEERRPLLFTYFSFWAHVISQRCEMDSFIQRIDFRMTHTYRALFLYC